MAYTAEDFRKEWDEAHGGRWLDEPVVKAALALAARVMEPGVIEHAISRRVEQVWTDPNEKESLAAAIRKALLGETE